MFFFIHLINNQKSLPHYKYDSVLIMTRLKSTLKRSKNVCVCDCVCMCMCNRECGRNFYVK